MDQLLLDFEFSLNIALIVCREWGKKVTLNFETRFMHESMNEWMNERYSDTLCSAQLFVHCYSYQRLSVIFFLLLNARYVFFDSFHFGKLIWLMIDWKLNDSSVTIDFIVFTVRMVQPVDLVIISKHFICSTQIHPQKKSLGKTFCSSDFYDCLLLSSMHSSMHHRCIY